MEHFLLHKSSPDIINQEGQYNMRGKNVRNLYQQLYILQVPE